MATSRFTDVTRLAESTLSLGPDAGALYDLGWAKSATGSPIEAMAAYEQALELYRAAEDRGNQAATLTSIGNAYARRGQAEEALECYQQALPILREVGDRAGEAVTRYNIAMIHRRREEFDQAVTELERVVELDRQVDHPDLASDTAMLDQVCQEQAASANADHSAQGSAQRCFLGDD